MKRLLLALVPWMVTTTAAIGQLRPATVFLSYHGILKGAAYRVGDECFVPVDVLRAAGWRIQLEDNRANINGEGRLVDVPLRTIDGTSSIALRKAIDKLGGDTKWLDGDQLQALSIIKSIDIHDGKVQIVSSMDIKPTLAFFDDPNRIVIDFPGSRLSRSGDFQAEESAHVGQFKPDTVRVVINADDPAAAPPGFDKATHTFSFDTRVKGIRPRSRTLENPAVEPKFGQMNDDGSEGGVLPPPAQQTSTLPLVPNVGPLSVELESTQALVMSMKLAGPLSSPPLVTRPELTILEISLPGTDLKLADGFKLDSDTVEQVTTRREGNTSFISLRTKRPVGAEVVASATEIVIRISKPNVGDGKLAGKTIVVDAGHGGHDTGARAPDGSVIEKDLTLSFAKAVSEQLIDEGAIVIMTRKTDVFIPLEERADIANRNHADFFISIHVNSNSVASGSSGGITFYHLSDPVCQLLAQSIQHEIGSVVSIPSMGVWSDGRMYRSGFSVLRHSKMPAVLIETGFISHRGDRAKLQTEEYRDSMAAGVVRGLKVFIGDVKSTNQK